MNYVWQWMMENKEWIFSGIGVAILGVFVRFILKCDKKGKKKKQGAKGGGDKQVIIIKNNLINQPGKTVKSNGRRDSDRTGGSKPSLELIKSEIYYDSVKGKIYKSTLQKAQIRKFAIEIGIKNHSAQYVDAKVGWHIYNAARVLQLNGDFIKTISPHSVQTATIYINENAFGKLKPGTYRYQVSIDGKKGPSKTFSVKK